MCAHCPGPAHRTCSACNPQTHSWCYRQAILALIAALLWKWCCCRRTPPARAGCCATHRPCGWMLCHPPPLRAGVLCHPPPLRAGFANTSLIGRTPREADCVSPRGGVRRTTLDDVLPTKPGPARVCRACTVVDARPRSGNKPAAVPCGLSGRRCLLPARNRVDSRCSPDDVHVVGGAVGGHATVLASGTGHYPAVRPAWPTARSGRAVGVGRARILPDALPDWLSIYESHRRLPDDRLRLVLPRLHATRILAAHPDCGPGRRVRRVVCGCGSQRRAHGCGDADQRGASIAEMGRLLHQYRSREPRWPGSW